MKFQRSFKLCLKNWRVTYETFAQPYLQDSRINFEEGADACLNQFTSSSQDLFLKQVCSPGLPWLTRLEYWKSSQPSLDKDYIHQTPCLGDVCLNIRYLRCPGSPQSSEFHLLLYCSSAYSLGQKRARIPGMKQHFSFYSPFEYCNILSTRTGYLVIRWVTSKMHSGIPRRRANRLLFLSCTDTNIYLKQ